MKHLLLAAIIASSIIVPETHAAVQGRLWYNKATGVLVVGRRPFKLKRNRLNLIPVTLDMLKGPQGIQGIQGASGKDATITPELLATLNIMIENQSTTINQKFLIELTNWLNNGGILDNDTRIKIKFLIDAGLADSETLAKLKALLTANGKIPVTPCAYADLQGTWSFHMDKHNHMTINGNALINTDGAVISGILEKCLASSDGNIDSQACEIEDQPLTGQFVQDETSSCKFYFTMSDNPDRGNSPHDWDINFIGNVTLDANKSSLVGSVTLPNSKATSSISFTKIP